MAGRRGLEPALALLALCMLSPLVLYARQPVMPLAALWGVAGGIALALMLTGRRLHAAILADALGRRKGAGGAWAIVGLMAAVAFLAFFAIVICLLLLLRRAVGSAGGA